MAQSEKLIVFSGPSRLALNSYPLSGLLWQCRYSQVINRCSIGLLQLLTAQAITLKRVDANSTLDYIRAFYEIQRLPQFKDHC